MSLMETLKSKPFSASITEGVLTLYKIKYKMLKVYRFCMMSTPSCTIVQASTKVNKNT